MSPRFECRLATSDDWSFVQSMDFDNGPPEVMLRQKLANGDMFVAADGPDLVGYMRIDYLYSMIPNISLVVVVPDRRGQGIGTALLAFVEGALVDRGHTQLLSSCELDEPKPQEWHRKMGFRDCGVLFGINEGRYGDLFLRKQIGR